MFSTRKKTYSITRGDVFITFPSEEYTVGPGQLAPGQLIWLQIDISKADQLLFLCPEAAKELLASLKSLSHHKLHIDTKKCLPLLTCAFEATYHEKNLLLTASYLQIFLQLLISHQQQATVLISPGIQRAVTYIKENLCQELSLEYLASLSGLSNSRFKRNFQNELGTSPRHFINEKKIEYAKELLLQGHSITDTAMLLNYSSSSYFSNVFKKYTLCTPLEFVHRVNRMELTKE